jgi:hypothetical protein
MVKILGCKDYSYRTHYSKYKEKAKQVPGSRKTTFLVNNHKIGGRPPSSPSPLRALDFYGSDFRLDFAFPKFPRSLVAVRFPKPIPRKKRPKNLDDCRVFEGRVRGCRIDARIPWHAGRVESCGSIRMLSPRGRDLGSLQEGDGLTVRKACGAI